MSVKTCANLVLILSLGNIDGTVKPSTVIFRNINNCACACAEKVESGLHKQQRSSARAAHEAVPILMHPGRQN
ncbi:hypothetical protein ACIGGE_13640 [Qipengyuania sp. NPDC077410]|uniref:hypothetical protein n=1 Tax=Qipengyuania sp. NPDC077410 TaxID=3364496 RepID=UPI0037C815DF